MIFSEDFDSALCMILESDKKNKEKILGFIDSMPSDFYKKISLALEKYYEYEENQIDVFDREDICLMGETLDVDNCKYSFLIDMMIHSLTITKSEKNDNNYNKVFELTLFSNSGFNNIDVFGKQVLGSLYDVYDSVKLNYNLVDTMFGRMFNVTGAVINRYRRIPFKSTSRGIDIQNSAITNGYSRVRRMH